MGIPAAAQSSAGGPRHGRALFVLVALAGLSVGATTIYLPSLPGIVDALATDTTSVQLTITGYLLGMMAGQMVNGPLSDHYGRRIVILMGLGLATAASLFCATVQSVELLILGRAVQAFGLAGGLVVSRAAVRDLFPDPVLAARANSAVVSAIAVAPIVAPLLGGWLDHALGWRAGFLVIGTCCAALLIAALSWFPETLAARRGRRLSLAGVVLGYGIALQAPGFIRLAAANCGVFAMMYAFNTAAPIVMIEGLGISQVTFGILTALFGIGMLAGSLLSSRLGRRLGVERLILIAVATDMAACAAMALGIIVLGPGVAVIYVPVFLLAAGLGLGFPNIAAAAIATNPGAAGTTSAVVGGMQVAAGAFGSAVIAMLPGSDALPPAIVMLGFAVIALAAWLLGGRPRDGRTDR